MANTEAAVGIIKSIFGQEATFGGAPAIENTTASIAAAWDYLSNGYKPRLNDFTNALVNTIGMSFATDANMRDNWNVFEKGPIGPGATVQELYVRAQNGTPFFNANRATNDEVLKAEFGANPATVYSAFYAINARTRYDVTISRENLALAFTSWEAMDAFIDKLRRTIIDGAKYDAFIMKKYLIYQLIKAKKAKKVKVNTVTNAETASELMEKLRGTFLNLDYPSGNYNAAGVPMSTPSERLYTIVPNKVAAVADVRLFANAFNMDKAYYMGHQLGVNTFAFTEYEVERLEHLLTGNGPKGSGDTSVTVSTGGDETFVHVIPNDPDLENVQAVLVDRDFFQVYTVLDTMTENELRATLNNKYFHHVWKIYAASPYQNCVVFTSAADAS